jgi:hypothetical protein
MKYLKEYTKINENESGENLSFDEFKEIMFYITDDFEHEFKHIKNNNEDYYDCWIFLTNLVYRDINDYQYEFLKIGPTQYPTSIRSIEDYKRLNMDLMLEKELEILNEKLDYINKRIYINEKLKPFLELIEKNILPKFMNYKNFLKATIGGEYYDGGVLRITFNMK